MSSKKIIQGNFVFFPLFDLHITLSLYKKIWFLSKNFEKIKIVFLKKIYNNKQLLTRFN